MEVPHFHTKKGQDSLFENFDLITLKRKKNKLCIKYISYFFLNVNYCDVYKIIKQRMIMKITINMTFMIFSCGILLI